MATAAEGSAQFFQWENDGWKPISGVPPTDRGFRHGMSAFETILVRDGRWVFLSEHLSKLRHAATVIGLRELPENLETSVRNGDFGVQNGVARLYLTAGDGGFAAPLNAGRLVLFLEEPVSVAARPLRLRLHPGIFNAPWPGLKTGNYAPQFQAQREALAIDCDGAVLVNAAKHVISAATANLFAVIDGMLVTPRTASGARAGVIRDWVLSHAEVIVCDFHPEQLRGAEEIFLTNSLLGVASVGIFEDREIPSDKIAQSLRSNL